MNTEAVLALVDRAFGDCAKPTHFTDWTHCLECRDYDQRLRERERDTLRREDLGSPGSDPMSFCSAAGYAYYAPALARFALAAPDPSHDWYGDMVLFQLAHRSVENRFLRAFSGAQRSAMAALLAAIPRAYPEYANAEEISRFDAAASLWRKSAREA